MLSLAAFLVALLFAACVVAVLKIDLTPKPGKGKPVERTRNFGEGLKLAQHGLYGVDLVSIGKAHMRKLRKGPFTIGAINELVLEDVSLVLPEELWRPAPRPSQPSSSQESPSSRTDPAAMLSKLGLDAGNLKFGAKVPRFSALMVRGLRVSRLDGTNVVPWFAAASGKAERGGLHLYSGWSFENGVTNAWKEAILGVEPTLKLWTQQ